MLSYLYYITRPRVNATGEFGEKSLALESPHVIKSTFCLPESGHKKGLCPMSLLQHYLNAMHVYCYLRYMGLSKRTALKLARRWERRVHPVLYFRPAGQGPPGAHTRLVLSLAGKSISLSFIVPEYRPRNKFRVTARYEVASSPCFST